MCLKVFCEGNTKQYSSLEVGARALGSAYQKVNFLRDMAADYKELGRLYFPGTVQYETFSEADKSSIIADIEADFADARTAIPRLPVTARSAVQLSERYYSELLQRIKDTPAQTLKTQRIRIPNAQKVTMLVPFYIKTKVRG
jgi:phytoene synthase